MRAHVFSWLEAEVMRPRDAVPVLAVGAIDLSLQGLAGELLQRLSLLGGERLQRRPALLDLPRQALRSAQSVPCSVGGALQLPHRLSSSVCLLRVLALLYFLFLDGFDEVGQDSGPTDTVLDDHSGDVAAAQPVVQKASNQDRAFLPKSWAPGFVVASLAR